jgi:hypothetical protein
VGSFALYTRLTNDALPFVKSMIEALKGKTRCSNPVKTTVAQKLADLIACRADFRIRQAINESFLEEFAVAKSS